MGFSRQEYWSGLPFLSQGDLIDLGIKPESAALVGGFFTSASPGKPLNKAHAELNSIQRPEWGFITVHIVRSPRERKDWNMFQEDWNIPPLPPPPPPPEEKTIQDIQDFNEEHRMLNPGQEGRRVKIQEETLRIISSTFCGADKTADHTKAVVKDSIFYISRCQFRPCQSPPLISVFQWQSSTHSVPYIEGSC